ncbi:hypothetical protein F7725_001682, partial [Dissostichus mawsoni]
MRSPVCPFDSGLANIEGSERPRPPRGVAHVKKSSSRLLILLLLSLSGNVNINPGPECFSASLQHLPTPNEPPSAIMDATTSLTELLSKFSSDIILLVDLNWDWLSDKSSQFKQVCDSLNLTQLIDSPTRINPAKPNNDTLIDTNAAHKYVSVGVFPNDISDHCTIACVSSTKLPKAKGLIVLRRCFKHFSEQAFLHDLAENKKVSSFPQKLKVSDSFISDTNDMSNAFNAHFKRLVTFLMSKVMTLCMVVLTAIVKRGTPLFLLLSRSLKSYR